jgi:hypothetical protein
MMASSGIGLGRGSWEAAEEFGQIVREHDGAAPILSSNEIARFDRCIDRSAAQAGHLAHLGEAVGPWQERMDVMSTGARRREKRSIISQAQGLTSIRGEYPGVRRSFRPDSAIVGLWG